MGLMHLNSLLSGLPASLPTSKISVCSSANLSFYFTGNGQEAR